jgi:predicted transcriptional regulator
VDGSEADCLFGAIDAFLCEKRFEAHAHDCRSFWLSRPSITRDEIALLADLTREALCAEAIASRLARDRCSTEELLDALRSVGLVEQCGARYRATPAAALYCWSLSQDSLPD